MEPYRLTRRRLVAAGITSGIAAATVLRLPRATLAADTCTLIPEQELGPYYIAEELLRGDVTEGRPGIPLALKIVVLDARSCRPLAGAAVDIWHCDSQGVYSGFTQASAMPSPPPDAAPPGGTPTGQPPLNPPGDAQTFLRGIQIAAADGVAGFRTILPGCYPGRTNHIHFKVRIDGAAAGKTYQGGHVAHTGQVFFPEEIAAALMQAAPYAAHKVHRTTQQEDGVFTRQHGAAAVAKLQPLATGGFAATLVAAVDPTAV